MSTTFQVYPKKEYIPTFQEVIKLTNSKLNDYISNTCAINITNYIDVEIQTIKGHNKVPFNIVDGMKWDDKNYAWFYVNGVAGGTDCYFYTHTDLDRRMWMEELATKTYNQEIKTIIKSNLNVGHYWSFRRSAGQPGIIALSYGFLAASIAKITEGFVYSDDGAWNYAMFPAMPEDFFKWYFQPELADCENDKIFSTNCIKSLYNELK